MGRVGQGIQSPEGQPRRIDGQLFLPYPLAFAGGEGEPSPDVVLDDLWTREWIVRDPRRPLVRVREQDGVSGILLTATISEHLLALGDSSAGAALSSGHRPAADRKVPSSLQSTPSIPATPPARPAKPASTRTGAADYALALEQRLLARDPTLGPIQAHENALSVALHGPVLDDAKAAGIAAASLLRALRKRPQVRVEQGRLILGL